MKHIIHRHQIVLLALISLFFSFWTIAGGTHEMGRGLSQKWQQFIENSAAQASDHNKLKDCVSEGEAL